MGRNQAVKCSRSKLYIADIFLNTYSIFISLAKDCRKLVTIGKQIQVLYFSIEISLHICKKRSCPTLDYLSCNFSALSWVLTHKMETPKTSLPTLFVISFRKFTNMFDKSRNHCKNAAKNPEKNLRILNS